MSREKNIRYRENRRRFRVRGKVVTGRLPRVSVFRSLKHIYAQLIDESGMNTITSSSSLKLDPKGMDGKAIASVVGQELAKSAAEKGIVNVCFDRGVCRYHGRVKALADGLRDGGLKF